MTFYHATLITVHFMGVVCLAYTLLCNEYMKTLVETRNSRLSLDVHSITTVQICSCTRIISFRIVFSVNKRARRSLKGIIRSDVRKRQYGSDLV